MKLTIYTFIVSSFTNGATHGYNTIKLLREDRNVFREQSEDIRNELLVVLIWIVTFV